MNASVPWGVPWGRTLSATSTPPRPLTRPPAGACDPPTCALPHGAADDGPRAVDPPTRRLPRDGRESNLDAAATARVAAAITSTAAPATSTQGRANDTVRMRAVSGEACDPLAIRWFTPRGRAAVGEFLAELRHGDGARADATLADLRRPGAPEGALDLRGVDLRREDLASAKLRGADLRGAILDHCDLSLVDLTGANLRGASLRSARLRGAHLGGATLFEADLRKADLTDADLEGALVAGARLEAATIVRTRLAGVDLRDLDLHGVDLSAAIRNPVPPPAPAIRPRDPLGRPPVSEPRRTTERTRSVTKPLGKLIPHESVRVARAALAEARAAQERQASFDEALAALVRLRLQAERVTVQIDGVERVLFDSTSERADREVG